MTRTLADFIGSYTLTRKIIDTRAQAESRFEGTAQITPAAGALYKETGELIMGDQRFQAERSYLWQPKDDRIEVLFADGRPFHDFDPDLGGKATEHLCGADWYRGGYDFTNWPDWTVTWDVDGPRKDYRSVTLFNKR